MARKGMKLLHAWQTPKAGRNTGWVLLDLGMPIGMKFTPETSAKLSAMDVSFVELKDGSFSGYAFKSNRPFQTKPTMSPQEELEDILKDATLVARKGTVGEAPSTPTRKNLV